MIKRVLKSIIPLLLCSPLLSLAQMPGRGGDLHGLVWENGSIVGYYNSAINFSDTLTLLDIGSKATLVGKSAGWWDVIRRGPLAPCPNSPGIRSCSTSITQSVTETWGNSYTVNSGSLSIGWFTSPSASFTRSYTWGTVEANQFGAETSPGYTAQWLLKVPRADLYYLVQGFWKKESAVWSCSGGFYDRSCGWKNKFKWYPKNYLYNNIVAPNGAWATYFVKGAALKTPEFHWKSFPTNQ